MPVTVFLNKTLPIYGDKTWIYLFVREEYFGLRPYLSSSWRFADRFHFPCSLLTIRGIIIFQDLIFPIHFNDCQLVSVERDNLPPEHYLDPEGQSSKEWEDDGGDETDKEWQKRPGGEDEEEEDDEDEVSDHPGDQEQVLVKEGAKEQEEGEEEMEHHSGDDSIEDGVVITVKNIKIGLSHVQHLKI